MGRMKNTHHCSTPLLGQKDLELWGFREAYSGETRLWKIVKIAWVTGIKPSPAESDSDSCFTLKVRAHMRSMIAQRCPKSGLSNEHGVDCFDE